MKFTKKLTAGILSTVMLMSFASCGSEESETVGMGDMTDEERIITAAQAGKIGNWGLGNEYEIQALLTKYGQPTDYVSMDFTMDQFDQDVITLASALSYSELGLGKNDYEGG